MIGKNRGERVLPTTKGIGLQSTKCLFNWNSIHVFLFLTEVIITAMESLTAKAGWSRGFTG